MASTNVELTLDQILMAIRKLPIMDQLRLYRTLDTDLNKDQIRRNAAEAIEAIRAANDGFSEQEVLADVDAAVAQVRAERRARRA